VRSDPRIIRTDRLPATLEIRANLTVSAGRFDREWHHPDSLEQSFKMCRRNRPMFARCHAKAQLSIDHG
jgi:hypothetical protein